MCGVLELRAGVGDHRPQVLGYVLVAHGLHRLQVLGKILQENGEA